MINISVIIPVYNAKDFIVDCLKSVVAQTFSGSIECLLVDDCGVDNSIDFIEKFISAYEGAVHFIILRQEQNQGPSAARNRGIREAKGEYIFFLDADDKISEDCLESLYSLAEKYKLDYVQGMYHSDENYHMPVYKSDDSNKPIIDRKVIKQLLLNYTIIPFTPHNRLVRHQFLIDNNLFFPEEIKVREDFYWMFFVAKYVKRMAICNIETYFRGYNGDSLTHRKNTEQEIVAYRFLLQGMCSNIDPFMIGVQKELVLSTLIMGLNSFCYHDTFEKKYLVNLVANTNRIIERILFYIVIGMKESFLRTKILHLLVRLYKL